MDYGVGAGGGRCGSAALQWESIRKRGWASAETTQILSPWCGCAAFRRRQRRTTSPSPPSPSRCRHLSPTMSFTPSKPHPRSHWKKLTQLALSSFMPSAAPKTSRKPSSFSCTVFSEIVCCLLSNVCVGTSFCQSLQAMSSFMHFPICVTYGTLSGQNIRLNQHKGICRPVYG